MGSITMHSGKTFTCMNGQVTALWWHLLSHKRNLLLYRPGIHKGYHYISSGKKQALFSCEGQFFILSIASRTQICEGECEFWRWDDMISSTGNDSGTNS